MDSKKANLTPELKEIYDRVMNTTSTPKAPAQPSQQAAPTPQNPPSPPIQPQGMPSLSEPIAPPPLPGPQQPPPVQPQFHGPQNSESLTETSNPAEEALSSTPARPISNDGVFSFSGGSVKNSPTTQSGLSAQGNKKTLISKPILIILGLIFVVIWGIFWAIIFGLIQR